jgi:ferredoxin
MNSEIYYFSGTGYSLSVAKDLASRLEADLIPVISTINKEKITTEADTLGFIFPIYDFKAPPIMNDLINKIEDLQNKYIFAVCTYGVMPLDTMKKLEKEIKSAGGNLSGGFGIKMPHNGLGYDRIPQEVKKQMFEDSGEIIHNIADYVKKHKKGEIEKGSPGDRLKLAGILVKMIPTLAPMLKQAIFHGWDSLGFHSDEKCNSCGTCETICPVDNIDLKNGRPVWGDKCISCFACIHWCPMEAIQIADLTKKMERHHHPDVTIPDMIKQKNPR